MALRPAQGALLLQTPRPSDPPAAAAELVLHHDVLCAWSYVADARLEFLRDEYGPALRWSYRPYPTRSEPQLPDKKQRTQQARTVRRVAREPEAAGIKPDLWTGQDAPLSSVPALVALEAALLQGAEQQRALLAALRRAAFIDGINVARRDVQVELAARVGLDLPRFLAALDSSRLEHEVQAGVTEAESLGVRGVPALVIGGEWLMQGCRELSEYRQVIDKYLRERVASAQVRTMH